MIASASSPARKARPTVAPLSLQQEWLWDVLQTERCWNFLTAFAWRLTGSLQVNVLNQCFSDVVRRHESLRTKILLIDGTPKQQVEEPHEHNLEAIDFSDRGEDEAYRYVSVFFSKYFDLAKGPVFETRLLRLADQEHILAIAIHHIVTDAVSVCIFFRELWTLYRSYIEERPPALDPVRMQYTDYAISQRNAESKWLETHAPYWKSRLRGANCTRLKAEPRLENITDPNGIDTRMILLGESLTASLNRVARFSRVTPSIAVFALYTFALSRFCDQSDLVISNNVAGRDGSDCLNVMGYLPHFVPLRIQLAGDENLFELLALVSHEFVTACQHLDRSCVVGKFPEMVRAARFQWISTHPNKLSTQVSTNDGRPVLSVQPFPVKRELRAGNALEIDAVAGFYDTDRGITGSVGFRRCLGTPQRLDQFCQEFRSLTESAFRQPRTRLGSLRI